MKEKKINFQGHKCILPLVNFLNEQSSVNAAVAAGSINPSF